MCEESNKARGQESGPVQTNRQDAQRIFDFISHMPFISGNVIRRPTARQNNCKRAGERYRSFEDWGRDELIGKLVSLISQCDRDVQERMVSHLSECDQDYGRGVAEGLGLQTNAGPAAGVAGAR